MPLSATHKGILIGLVVGALAYHLWMQRAGKGAGPPPEGG